MPRNPWLPKHKPILPDILAMTGVALLVAGVALIFGLGGAMLVAGAIFIFLAWCAI
jgi:hypothetical protein